MAAAVENYKTSLDPSDLCAQRTKRNRINLFWKLLCAKYYVHSFNMHYLFSIIHLLGNAVILIFKSVI